MNSHIANYTSYNHVPGSLSGPASGRSQHPSGETLPRSRVGCPLGRNSASLEGWTPPRAKLRLLEGYAHPRAGLRLARGLPWARHPTPPTGALNAVTRRGRPGQEQISALFRQPSSRGHLRHCTALCDKASVNSVTLCHPLPYGRRTAPSKEDKGYEHLSRAHAGQHRDQWSVSPPSPSALYSHPRYCATIPHAVAPSPALWEPGTTRHRHARCCASYGPPSTAPSSQRTDGDQTESSHRATLDAAPGRLQDSP
jgi:hypothetical protein